MAKRFPWLLLAKYGPSMSQISDMCCHCGDYKEVHETNLLCCDKGSIIELDNDYWLVVDNYAYDIVVELLHDGGRECRLPTTACKLIAHLKPNEMEQISC
jgi:hypothetical protein